VQPNFNGEQGFYKRHEIHASGVMVGQTGHKNAYTLTHTHTYAHTSQAHGMVGESIGTRALAPECVESVRVCSAHAQQQKDAECELTW
jgi:hypothetical protein